MTFCPPLSRHFITHGRGDFVTIVPAMTGTKEIGLAVKAARERAGLTQPALAARLEVDDDTIKKIEAGRRVEKWLWLGRVAKALGTSPNEILGFPAVSPESLEMALRPILAAYGASPQDADSIARILLEAVSIAQSSPGDEPEELRYRLAGQPAASRFRRR